MSLKLLTTITNNIEKDLKASLFRGLSLKAYLNRVVYAKYQNAQRRRWMTEGQSQGAKWKPLNPAYKIKKLKRFAKYEGGGRRMVIATNALQKSVIGSDTTHHRKIVTNRSITIGTNLEYAKYVNEDRNIFDFNKRFEEDIVEGVMRYIMTGVNK